MKIRLPETLEKKLLEGKTITIYPKYLSNVETHDYFSPDHTKHIVTNLQNGRPVRGTLNRADWIYLERTKNYSIFLDKPQFKNSCRWNKIHYIAHRGYTKKVKGNTEQAFRLALEKGFTMLEIDLQMTKDGKIILYHDAMIRDRMIPRLTFAEVIVLDASILTLPKFLKTFYKKNTKIFLDVKAMNPEIVPVLANDLRGYDMQNIFVFSFYIPILETIKCSLPKVHLGLATANNFPRLTIKNLIDEFQLSFIVVHWKVLTNEFMRNLHNHNQLIFAYTLQEDEANFHAIQKKILALPLDGIITNATSGV